MKKLFVILLVVLMIFTGCKKDEEVKPKEEKNTFEIKSIDTLIEYNVLDHYESVDEYSLVDFNEEIDIVDADKIIIEKNYSSTKDDGYFQVEIFSYKGSDPEFNFEPISYDDYIGHLVRKTTLNIDNHEFVIGYSGGDDVDDMIARAYVIDKDYIFRFSESNFDVPVTSSQYEEFINMIKTVKFK